MTEPQASVYWLDRVKKDGGFASDYELAKALQMSRAGVSQIRSGKIGIGIKTAIRIGWLIQVDPLLVISSVMFHQETKGDAKDFWYSVYKRCPSKKL